MSVNRKLHGVIPGERRWAERRPRRVVGDCRNRILMTGGIRRGVAQIPNPSMHSSGCGKYFLWPQPIEGDQLLFEILLADIRLVGARVAANYGASGVENFEG